MTLTSTLKLKTCCCISNPLKALQVSNIEYCQFVADQLNKLLPDLPFKLKWEHISTAHYLPTKSKKSNVIIVRFANRCVKEAVFNLRHTLPRHLAITEHLTERNLCVLKKAQELFGRFITCTINCKVNVKIDDRSHPLSSVEEVHKLFVEYCERIGHDDSANVINLFSPTNAKPSYSSTVKNNSNRSYLSKLEKFNPVNTYEKHRYFSRTRSFYSHGK